MSGFSTTVNGVTHDDLGVNGNLLAVTQVAQRLNAHPHSVRRWADSGLLDYYRIGFRATAGSSLTTWTHSCLHGQTIPMPVN